MATLTLSNVLPDPEDILAQLQAELASSDAWRGNVETQVGQTLLRLIAAIGALDQAKIRRNFQDVFPETAVSDRASYALAVHQGVRINRKLPAAITADLLSTGVSLTVPAYSSFQGGGSFFFNREAVFLASGVTTEVTLYQGIVKTITTVGLGQDFALFSSQEADFTISDIDVRVKIDGVTIARTYSGMWKLKGIAGFVDRTMPNGRLLIEFGNDQFGSRPDTNETVEVVYATTAGEGGNSLNTMNKSITAEDYASITGLITSQPTGGADQRDPVVYKNIAAPTFGTFGSAITRPQYITTALQYPGVIDVVTFAQREVNPFSLEWMNLIKVVPLTSTVWNPTQIEDFLEFLQENTAYAPRFFYQAPLSIPMNIEATVYCYNWANTPSVQSIVQQALIDFFDLRAGILNFNVYISDIVSAIQTADKGVEYIELATPTEDLIINGEALPGPLLTVIPSGGTLAVGTYYYGIGILTGAGNITVRLYSSATVTVPNSSIQLNWDESTIATGYTVYGRSPSTVGLGLLATTAANVRTFTDTGAVTPGAEVPPQNTLPVRYVQPGTISVVAKYSTRNLRSY